jgi:ABC-type nitrate/sulfonate/bicarbonate transport system substrate-binding protein
LAHSNFPIHLWESPFDGPPCSRVPETIRDFLKAFVAGLKIAIEQPDVSKRTAARYLATKDQEIIDEAYNGFALLFPKIPYVTDEAIRSALSVTDHPKASSANPKDLYDNRFLQELESSGFVKELYAAK